MQILSRGKSIYEESVRPILEAAGLQVVLVVTQRAKHATEYVRDMQLKGCDAIVLVGGDGTAYEALQVNWVKKRVQKTV